MSARPRTAKSSKESRAAAPTPKAARQLGRRQPTTAKLRTGELARNAGFLLGSHLSIAGGMHHALDRAVELGFGAVQVFVKNQRQWAAAPIKPESVTDWNAARDQATLGAVVAHATYLINLAAPNDTFFEKSVESFATELTRCDIYGIPYLVVHPGAACGQSLPEAVRRIAIALDTIFTAQPAIKAMPLLEMTAGQGSCLGCKWDQMAAILGAVKHPERLGICVDTCHVFAAGYDIRTSQGYQEMLREAQSAVGLSRIKCWHLNDSKADLGSRVDRHEHIGKGKIGLDGFRHVLHDERFRGLPMILETPKDETGRFDRDNLRRLEQLLKK